MVTHRIEATSSLLSRGMDLRRQLDRGGAAISELSEQLLELSTQAQATAILERAAEVMHAWTIHLRSVRQHLKSVQEPALIVEMLQAAVYEQQGRIQVLREFRRELRALHQPDLPLQ